MKNRRILMYVMRKIREAADSLQKPIHCIQFYPGMTILIWRVPLIVTTCLRSMSRCFAISKSLAL